MVRIFSTYHFSGQMVDTVDDMSALTVTNHNKLLIAQDDYSVEVKDLLSDKKRPVLVFPTVEKVHRICHCAAGNYVATVEGKQEFQKSDRLIVRIYTNWEADCVSESKMSPSFSKRYVRPRIAGIVTPSSAKADEHFLDMIEIPISFTSPTLLTVCQNTGKLLITCGPTMHLFEQVYTRSSHDKASYFMDFVSFTEVFQLDFLPDEVSINENIIASYSTAFVSVFKIKKLSHNELKRLSEDCYPSSGVDLLNVQQNYEVIFNSEEKTVSDSTPNVASIFEMIQKNQEDQIIKLIDPRSLPLKVLLKGVNDNNIFTKDNRLPFKIFENKVDHLYQNGKVRDNLVETLCDKDISFLADSFLALNIKDTDDLITKVALQVLCQPCVEDSTIGSQNESSLTGTNKRIVSINVLVTTYQEGYLFSATKIDLQKSLRCVAVFNFTSRIKSLLFDNCFLHVLTQTGLETYNVPSLHSTILHENPNLEKFSQYVSIIGIHPFMGIVDFIGSRDLIIIFTSANVGKCDKESFPWTVYSLKIPKLFEVYQEMIENSNSFKSRDDITYQYLSLESFLMLQLGLNLNLAVCNDIDDTLVKSTHRINSIELAKIYFRSGTDADIQIGTSVILAAELDPIEFVQSIELEKCNVLNGKIYLMKKWIEKHGNLSENEVEWLIKMFDESNEIIELSSFILSNKTICRACGHKAIPCFKAYVASRKDNSDAQVIYALVILYIQECFQDEAVKVLSFINNGSPMFRKSFVSVVLKFWKFLFDEMQSNAKNKVVLSDLSSLLCENLPAEMAEILVELILKENAFGVSFVVQMLMMEFPCHISVQKSTYILRAVLEMVFSSNVPIDYHDNDIKNCLKILARSYLNELLQQNEAKNNMSVDDFRTIFVKKLPSYVNYLPSVNNVNFKTLRRFQELIWSQFLDGESMKEIINPLSDVNLRLNLMAMLNQPQFTKDLIEHNCFEALLPYAKISLNSIKKWRDFINSIQHKICELEKHKENSASCERILEDVVNHLASNLSPSQLNAVLESSISKHDELFWNSILRAQQISYANDVKELIMNTSQQLLQSNPIN